MEVRERVTKALAEFAAASPNPEELGRLRDFVERMKDAGLWKPREYDLPLPDTLGRALVERGPGRVA